MRRLRCSRSQDLDKMIQHASQNNIPICFWDTKDIENYYDGISLPVIKGAVKGDWKFHSHIENDKEAIIKTFQHFEPKKGIDVGFAIDYVYSKNRAVVSVYTSKY